MAPREACSAVFCTESMPALSLRVKRAPNHSIPTSLLPGSPVCISNQSARAATDTTMAKGCRNTCLRIHPPWIGGLRNTALVDTPNGPDGPTRHGRTASHRSGERRGVRTCAAPRARDSCGLLESECRVGDRLSHCISDFITVPRYVWFRTCATASSSTALRRSRAACSLPLSMTDVRASIHSICISFVAVDRVTRGYADA